MTEYDRLAWFYDKYWTQGAPELFEQALNRTVLPALPDKAEILDLCCGTGRVCARLSRRLYRMTGLDNSETMLVIARENAPAASFVYGNAADFSFGKRFNCVISLFDSLNHILTPEELLSAFISVRGALKGDGHFFFDLNSEDSFDQRWEEGFSAAEDDNACIMKPCYDAASGRSVYNIVTFMQEADRWSREDIKILEQYYPEEEVVKLLTQADFHNIQVLSGAGDLGIAGFKGRVFFWAV